MVPLVKDNLVRVEFESAGKLGIDLAFSGSRIRIAVGMVDTHAEIVRSAHYLVEPVAGGIIGPGQRMIEFHIALHGNL